MTQKDRSTVSLADVTLVYAHDGEERRVTGRELARLLTFAETLGSGWDLMLSDAVETVPDDLRAFAYLLHNAEESADAIDPATLHFIHETLESMAARLVAGREDPARKAKACRVEVAAGCQPTRRPIEAAKTMVK